MPGVAERWKNLQKNVSMNSYIWIFLACADARLALNRRLGYLIDMRSTDLRLGNLVVPTLYAFESKLVENGSDRDRQALSCY